MTWSAIADASENFRGFDIAPPAIKLFWYYNTELKQIRQERDKKYFILGLLSVGGFDDFYLQLIPSFPTEIGNPVGAGMARGCFQGQAPTSFCPFY